jgi:hypothetical protein
MIKFDTAVSFINNHLNPSGYSAGQIISFEGYTTTGDKGAARWRSLGTVGTASVDPLTNNSPNLSDASGNEFVLVGEGVIDLNVLGGTGVSYQNIADAAGLVYSQGLTSNPNVSDRYIIADEAGMVARANPQVDEAYIVSDRADGIFDTVTVGTTANVDLPNTYNIIVSTVDATKCFVLRVQDAVYAKQLGMFDGVSDDAPAWPIFLSLSTQCFGAEGSTSITSEEIVLPEGVTLDLLGGAIKADPDLPNTGNIVKLSNAKSIIKNGKVDGNKSNLNNAFASGTTGNCIYITTGADGSRAIDIEAFNGPTNGIVVVGNAVDDIQIVGFNCHDNDFTGTGVELLNNGGGEPSNILIKDGITKNNNTGGGIRIQACNGYVIDNCVAVDEQKEGLVIGVAEANGVCVGKITNSTFGTANAATDGISIDGMVGGGGAQAGKINTCLVQMANVRAEGAGGATGLRVENFARVEGVNVTSNNFTNGHNYNSNASVSIYNPCALNSGGSGFDIDAKVFLSRPKVEIWSSTGDAVLFRANSGGSAILSGNFGAQIRESGSHDGAGNASTLSDSTANFIADELVGFFVRNTTDGSQGAITANTATTVTATLSGGTDNDWDASDVYEITSENGQDALGVVGTPADIRFEVQSFTGTRNTVGGVGGSVLNTWEVVDLGSKNMVELIDGIAAPASETGRAKMYINSSNGDLQIIFGDGVTKTIVTDI